MKEVNQKMTGIPFLPLIPDTWRVLPLFCCFEQNKDKNRLLSENQVLSLSYGKIKDRDVESNFGLLPESFDSYQIVNTDYIILRLTDLQNDKKSLRVGISPKRGIITSAYIGLKPNNNIHPMYGFYLLYTYDIKKVFYNLGNGVRQALKYSELCKLPFILPPLSTQKVISEFLDKETARIDALIEKKNRQIELLQEKRQAVITRAITKGLDPNAKMKDSGIEWIGEIPEGWEVRKLKHIGKAIIGLTYSPDDIVDENDSKNKFLVLRSTNIQQGELALEDNVYVSKKVDKELLIRRNDILICARNGSRNLVGKNVLIQNNFMDMTFGAFMTVFRSKINEYLQYFFLSNHYKYQSTGFLTATVNQLTNENLNGILVPVPPQIEREVIISFLDKETQFIDSLKSRIEESVTLLQEYRSSLITAVVSGQIDVGQEVSK
jgi:type I restriction enzyme S subunit